MRHGESSEEAALRELEEELGIDRFRSLLLGQLSPLYLFGTNFLITPWVAAVRDAVEFLPNREEVDEFLQVPLAHLLAAGQPWGARPTAWLAAVHGTPFSMAATCGLGRHQHDFG